MPDKLDIDRQGYFVQTSVGAPGILLRPDDYRTVRVFLENGNDG